MEDTRLVGVGVEWWKHNNRRRTIAKKGKRCRARSLEDEQRRRSSFIVLSIVSGFPRIFLRRSLQVGIRAILRRTVVSCLIKKKKKKKREKVKEERRRNKERRIVFCGGKNLNFVEVRISLTTLEAKVDAAA